MTDQVTATAERIAAIEWIGSFDRMTSRGYLMKEYLRRAAWWAKVTKAQEFPFFDIAAAVNPAVRADPSLVLRVTQELAAKMQGILVQETCANALHFAALLDARIPLPEAPEMPFEPLLVMFERGGGFRDEGSGLIDVDLLGIPIGSVEDNLRAEPYVQLGLTDLDALDREHRR
jgi:hypothetical protein